MFEKVLVPIDFSADSHYVVQCLKKIPNIREIILLHVVYSKYPSDAGCGLSPDVDYARLRLLELVKSLETTGLEAKAIVEEITGGEIADVINRVAKRERMPLVLMGRRGQGVIESLVLGSVASDVLRYGKTDLVLVHPPAITGSEDKGQGQPCPDFFSNVLVCTDFSEPEIVTLCRNELPRVQKATLLHVITTGASDDEIRTSAAAAKNELDKMREAFSSAMIPVNVQVSVGNAAEEIISCSSQENSSLIVLKSTGKRGMLANLLGSITGHVARNAHSPVLILRRT